MVTYNKYSSVDSGTIESDVSKIKTILASEKTKLTTLSESLTDDIYKADSKATLKEGFNKIKEAIEELESQLDGATSIASNVTKYKSAQNAIGSEPTKYEKNGLGGQTETQAHKNWVSNKTAQEAKMEEAIEAINGIVDS